MGKSPPRGPRPKPPDLFQAYLDRNPERNPAMLLPRSAVAISRGGVSSARRVRARLVRGLAGRLPVRRVLPGGASGHPGRPVGRRPIVGREGTGPTLAVRRGHVGAARGRRLLLRRRQAGLRHRCPGHGNHRARPAAVDVRSPGAPGVGRARLPGVVSHRVRRRVGARPFGAPRVRVDVVADRDVLLARRDPRRGVGPVRRDDRRDVRTRRALRDPGLRGASGAGAQWRRRRGVVVSVLGSALRGMVAQRTEEGSPRARPGRRSDRRDETARALRTPRRRFALGRPGERALAASRGWDGRPAPSIRDTRSRSVCLHAESWLSARGFRRTSGDDLESRGDARRSTPRAAVSSDHP